MINTDLGSLVDLKIQVTKKSTRAVDQGSKSENKTERKEEINIITVLNTEVIVDQFKTPTNNVMKKYKSRKKKFVEKFDAEKIVNCRKRKILNVRDMSEVERKKYKREKKSSERAIKRRRKMKVNLRIPEQLKNHLNENRKENRMKPNSNKM